MRSDTAPAFAAIEPHTTAAHNSPMTRSLNQYRPSEDAQQQLQQQQQ
eukprot:CAMPEP_0206474186 /NCGR_PEP_ID=MMETSP0324_2-20121206/33325_1 /ASSEMBLY_ACC=CAM_ASM_000836 /TAXON_ID=2866 /ORGANISM="Crypthecodinium cohnii, Strain Seligo" /LENGTH=46 /DNA_ID= /DNA_START= /DNA_END= /DNA_ORIENTATION=